MDLRYKKPQWFALETCIQSFSLSSYLEENRNSFLSEQIATSILQSKIEMAFGILEPVSSTIPSGTNLLENLRSASDPDGIETRLILVPKPSDSPLDPLKWPRYKKELLFGTIVFGACAAGSLGPVLVPGFTTVAILLDVQLTDMALLNGSLIMTLGVSAYLCPCIAEVYGKRMVYLVTTIIIVAGCCWAGAASSYNSLLGARAIQGEF